MDFSGFLGFKNLKNLGFYNPSWQPLVCQFWPKCKWQSFGYFGRCWASNWMYSAFWRCDRSVMVQGPLQCTQRHYGDCVTAMFQPDTACVDKRKPENFTPPLPIMVVWRSGSALVSIDEVNRRRARLVLGWVTVSVFITRCRSLSVTEPWRLPARLYA